MGRRRVSQNTLYKKSYRMPKLDPVDYEDIEDLLQLAAENNYKMSTDTMRTVLGIAGNYHRFESRIEIIDNTSETLLNPEKTATERSTLMQFKEGVEKGINSVPEEYRLGLWLHIVENVEWDEVTKVDGVNYSVGALKSKYPAAVWFIAWECGLPIV